MITITSQIIPASEGRQSRTSVPTVLLNKKIWLKDLKRPANIAKTLTQTKSAGNNNLVK
ncbi:MAG: hypothetical protein IT279_13615 [Ignavibacteriaceae bacterium]|nr:hypothetical protein [Ignavibacteriaceae bacterium]